jgi:hypothetical protein
MRTTGSTPVRALARAIGTITTVGLMVFGLAMPTALADTTFTVTGTAGTNPITYGDAPPTYGYSMGGAVLEAGDSWQTAPVCTSTYAQGDAAGSYGITCTPGVIVDGSTADVTGNYAITYAAGTLVVDEYAIDVTADDDTVTYGDPEPAGFTSTEDALVSGDTWATDPTCDSDYSAGDPAGKYAITCVGGTIQNGSSTDVTSSYAITYVDGTLTVDPYAMPDAEVEYTGQTEYRTRSSSDTAVQVTLTASIALDDSSDPGIQCPTDPDMTLDDARVTFVDAETGKVFARDVHVGAVPDTDCEGIATAVTTLSTGSAGVEDYTIRVILGGSFSGADNAGQTVGSTVTVFQPIPVGVAGGFGSGTLPALGIASSTDKGSTGAYADGEDASFIFRFVGSTKKTKPSGGATLTIPQDDGSYYEVKTNAITSVSVTGTVGVDRKIVVYAKANVTLFDGLGGSIPVDSTGGTSVQITIVDGASDTAAFTVTAPKTGALLFSNHWVKNAKAWGTALETITGSTVTLS